MGIQINSPYQSLGQLMFSPGQTASAASQGQAQLSRQYNPAMTAKNQPLNRGMSQHVGATLKGQGQYDVARSFMPASQRLQDFGANTQFGNAVQRGNNQSGLSGYGRLLDANAFNQQLLSQLFGMFQ